MRPFVYVGLAALALAPALAGQKLCAAHALDGPGEAVVAARQRLLSQAVAADDPHISPAIATDLRTLKDALAEVARAAFACSNASLSQEQMQGLLADTLHPSHVPAATARETRDGRQTGVYGADLAVQVFQLSSTPRFFEVDFRYGIACGDDHLLMIFRAPGDRATESWQEQLRWDAPNYTTVGDALGDFVLLTPLTGSADHPTWRFLVAHGHSGCADPPRTSRFDLDLLTPTADPARPAVSWHFDHPYTAGNVVPRLATTEDTAEFQLVPAAPPPDGAAAASRPEVVYQFHLDAQGRVVPMEATTSSPRSASGGAPR